MLPDLWFWCHRSNVGCSVGSRCVDIFRILMITCGWRSCMKRHAVNRSRRIQRESVQTRSMCLPHRFCSSQTRARMREQRPLTWRVS